MTELAVPVDIPALTHRPHVRADAHSPETGRYQTKNLDDRKEGNMYNSDYLIIQLLHFQTMHHSPVFTRILVLAEVLACLPDTLEVGKRIRAKSLVSAKTGTVRSEYEGTHSASGTVLYCTVLYCTVLYCTVLY